MGNRILVDTSILIDLQKGIEKVINEFKKHKDQVTISNITACEFIYGSRNSNEKRINKEFIGKIDILELNEDISKLTYTLLDKYSLKFNLGIADALIASTAIYNNIPLWTSNKKHFNNITELKLFK